MEREVKVSKEEKISNVSDSTPTIGTERISINYDLGRTL